MALESATYATQLVVTNPQSSDPRSQGDDHLRKLSVVVANEMSDVNAQWTYTGHVVTWQAAARLTVDGDQTNVYSQERRIRVDGDSVGSIYGNITSSTFSANTNINIRWDSTAAANETLTTWVGDQTREGWPQGPESYVSGVWTPVLTADTPGDISVVYTQQVGYYRRMGAMVFVHCTARATPTHTTASGDVKITGGPFSAWNDQADLMVLQTSSQNWPAGYSEALAYINSDEDSFRFRFNGDNVASLQMDMAHVPTGVNQLFRFSGWYMIR